MRLYCRFPTSSYGHSICCKWAGWTWPWRGRRRQRLPEVSRWSVCSCCSCHFCLWFDCVTVYICSC